MKRLTPGELTSAKWPSECGLEPGSEIRRFRERMRCRLSTTLVMKPIRWLGYTRGSLMGLKIMCGANFNSLIPEKSSNRLTSMSHLKKPGANDGYGRAEAHNRTLAAGEAGVPGRR